MPNHCLKRLISLLSHQQSFSFRRLNSLSSICLFTLTRVGSEDTEMRTAYAPHKDTEIQEHPATEGYKGLWVINADR
jgi:hypothetical protein